MKKFAARIMALLFCLALFAFVGCAQKAAMKDEAAGEKKTMAEQSSAATQPGAKMEEQKKGAQAGPVSDLSIIYFDFDQAIIKAEGKAVLDKHAKWLKANNAVSITIAGNCDERGTTEYNLALGQRRANAAAKYLTTLGIAKKRVKTVSYGKEKPVDPGHNEEAWAKNRRDEFIIKK